MIPGSYKKSQLVSWKLLSLDSPLEYSIELITIDHHCAIFMFSTSIFRRSVLGFVMFVLVYISLFFKRSFNDLFFDIYNAYFLLLFITHI